MYHKTERTRRYIGQVWAAINQYTHKLNDRTLLIGDLNSNAIWDEKNRIGNHTDVVNFLTERKIESIYHKQHACDHGNEEDATLYLLKKRSKPYHIDYCFASEELISSATKMSVGKYDEWIELSDHMPLIIDNIM